jgi:LmbE family N-acetylglucosaminyl deacetylase
MLRWRPRGLRKLVAPFLPGMRPAGHVLDLMESLPLQNVQGGTGGEPVLVLAPHPDDETLGCGGLIALACAAGIPVDVVLVTDGAASHPCSKTFPPQRLAAVRLEETRTALSTLGLAADRLRSLALPDGAAGQDRRALRHALEELTEHALQHRTRTICATWRHDSHGDHKVAFDMGVVVARRLSARLLAYPVWGWLLPRDRWISAPRIRGFRIDVQSVLPLKQSAIACHRTQNGMITDAVNGALLPEALLQRTCSRYEVYLECR